MPMTLADFVYDLRPIKPDHRVNEVGDMLLAMPEYSNLLSIPIVDKGIPTGVVSRYQLMDVFANRYGRDLHGKDAISELMNPSPTVVDIDEPLESAAKYIIENMGFPITEDFIVTRDGRYHGIGMVQDLLQAMEKQVRAQAATLESAYSELQDSQAQLVQSEKMASLGQMVAGIAHEINTPLGYVHGNVEVIREFFHQLKPLLSLCREIGATNSPDGAQNEAVTILLQRLREASAVIQDEESIEETLSLFGDTIYGVEQISELVLGLKDFSRLDTAKVDQVDINQCLDSALLISKNIIKHKAEIVKDYGDLPAIACAPSQINQVFLNLITNAAQSFDDHGIIRLKTEVDRDRVRIKVEDNGKGIPENTLPKIFDPFFTTKTVGEGTGLGLSIVYKIIEEHGGKIDVVSEVGRGTRFTIELPCKAMDLQKAS